MARDKVRRKSSFYDHSNQGRADKHRKQKARRLIHAVGTVSPELRAWLKEQEPKTADELGSLANLHVQSRKWPSYER